MRSNWQSSSCPKQIPKSASPSLSHLHHKLLQLQKNAIEQRRKLITDSRKQLNRSWRNLCNILQMEENSNKSFVENVEDQEILDSCLQVIIKQRISLQKQKLEIERIRNLYQKSMANSASGKLTKNGGKKGNVRVWRGKTKTLNISKNQ